MVEPRCRWLRDFLFHRKLFSYEIKMFREDHTAAERRKENMSTEVMQTVKTGSRNRVRKMVQVGMLSAIAVVLMLFEIPLPFAPAFYEIDFSEVPVLVGCFAMGPVAGVAIEFLKILLNFAINGTTTAGVGEVANFLIGCSLVVPAALIYKFKKTRNGAIIGMAAGTVFYDSCGMPPQRICAAAHVCGGVRHAGRRPGADGNSGQFSHHKPDPPSYYLQWRRLIC